MIEDDPYRSSGRTGTCPRCGAVIEGAPLTCLAGCGEFHARESLADVWHAIALGGGAPAWPQGPAPCPICRRDMQVAFRAELRFDRCDLHGVWLDAGEPPRFFELFRPRTR